MSSFLSSVRRGFAAFRESRSMAPQGTGAFVGTGLSGIAVTPDNALTLLPAFAAINVLSTDTATPPLMLYRTDEKGARKIIAGTALSKITARTPNGVTTPMRFRQALMGHCLGWGNGYAEILRDSWTGEPYGLNLLSPRPWDTWPERVNGRLIYKIQRGTKELLPENVIHIAGLSWDGLVGYSPVALAREAIGLALAAERFGASFYGNGSHASGWLKSPKKLSLEARRNLRESFEEQHRGTGNANRIGVLEDGLEFEKSSIDPEDAQFLLTRKFQVIEICRLYRVPPHKVMDYEHAHLANLEQSNTDYLMTSLFPWCLQIEQEFDLKLLTTQERDNGFAYAHNLRAFMRADSAARAAYWDLMARNGVVSPNQIAAEEGFDPIEGGDVHFCPLNMTVLANIGKPSNDTQKRSTNEAA